MLGVTKYSRIFLFNCKQFTANHSKLLKTAEMNIETTNFENFTADEYRDNLLRLGATSHSSFIGKGVYYVKKGYGLHTVVK